MVPYHVRVLYSSGISSDDADPSLVEADICMTDGDVSPASQKGKGMLFDSSASSPSDHSYSFTLHPLADIRHQLGLSGKHSIEVQ